MPVLLAILKVLAFLLLVVAALVTIAMLLPLGFAVEYKPGQFRVSAVYGPLRRTVWARGGRGRKRHAGESPPEPRTAATETKAPPGTDTPPELVSVPKAAPEPSVPASEESGKRELPEAPMPEMPPEEEEETSGVVQQRLIRILELAGEDPKALASCVLGHMRWLERHSLFKIHVRHLNVFWTVTCEDASDTAIAYGAEMAALNTALALVQQTVRLQSDRLWLEPDFTGARRAERWISCTVSARAILMFHLLYRIWNDPLLKPQAQSDTQPV